MKRLEINVRAKTFGEARIEMEKLLKAVDGKTDNESRSLKKLIITAIINDKDVVDAYKDVHPDLINEDIHKGNLARYPTVTDVRLE